MIIQGIDTTPVAGWASQWWNDRKNERLIKERIWNECLLAYDCRFGETWEDLDDYRSKRYLSLPWQAVETEASSIVNGCMPTDWFSLLGRTPGDEQKANAMEALLKYQHFRTKFRSKFKLFAKAACIFGNVPYCVDWREDLIDIPDEEAFAAQMGNMNLMKEIGMEAPPSNFRPTKRIRSYDGPDFHIGSIFDFVIDMKPSNPDYAMRGIKFFRTKAYLEARSNPDENGYALYENIENISNENTDRDSSDSLRRMTERQIGIARNPSDMVELIQYEGDFEIPSLGYFHNHILVVANRSAVVRFEPNPFIHGKPTWNLFSLNPEPNEVYGRGILEPVLGINDGIQCAYNQALEARALIVNPGFKYKEDGVFDADDFLSAPGALVKCADPNNVMPLVVPDKTMTSFQEINFAINQLNLITGTQSNFGGDSATEVSLEASQGKERRKETINHITDTLLMDVLEREIALNQQLMDEPVWVRIITDGQSPMTGMPLMADPDSGIQSALQPQQMKVAPEDIVGEFDIMPIGAADVQQDHQKAQEVFQLTTTILQSPAAQTIKLPEFVNEMYKMMGFHGAWKFIKSPEELQFEQQQQFAQQLAIEQQKRVGQSGGQEGGQGGDGTPGPKPGPQGLASLPGMAEGPGATPAGPSDSQLGANRLD